MVTSQPAIQRPTANALLNLRRGGATSSLLIILSLITTLTVATVIITPRYLRAEGDGPSTVKAHSSAHQVMLENLATLIGGCAEVLAIHKPGAVPFTEVVLWLEDGEDAGRINTHEIAILSHSRVMQTIVCTMIGPAEVSESAWPNGAIERSEAVTQEFCTRFRSQPAAVAKVIGSAVSDIRFEWSSEADRPSSLLWISLSWAPDSADGPDEASLFVDVLSRHGINQE